MTFLPILVFAACHPGKVSNSEEAELAYLGLDRAVERALALGLQGYSQASSANIADQEQEGETSGSMVVGGQVDQGSSDNKGLRLDVTLTEYSDTLGDDDEPDLLYDTEVPASLELQLKGMPDGTLDGTFAGTFAMRGVLTGLVELSLTLSGDTEDDGAGGVRRVEESTTVVGTATSDYGVYDVDLVR